VLSPSLHNYNMKMLENENAIYPFINSEVKTFSIPKDAVDYISENLFTWTQLPHRIIIGFIPSGAFNGTDLDKNPWCFLQHDVTSINIYVDSDGSVFKGSDLIYDSEDQMLPLQIMRNALGSSFAIGRDMLELGYSFYYYELTSSDAVTNGRIKIDIKFKKAVPNALTAVVFGQKSSILTIDNTFNINIQ